MLNSPLISFCFTTYKRHDYLKKTLESVNLQTYKNFEVIVSDNDPDASGKTVVESFGDSRFKYFANEENLGMKKSFNRSLSRSSGEFIVMIADDDPVYPDMLETLIDLYNQHPGYGMYLGGSNYFFTNPDIAKLCGTKVGMNSCLANIHTDTIRTFSPSEFLKDFFDMKIFPAYLWSVGMVNKEILVKQGGVPDYDTPFLGDYAYLSIMGSHSGCAVINKPLGHQTVHEQNFGRAQNDQLVKVGPNFINYVSKRISHVEEWQSIEKKMRHFVGSWLVTHLTFLRNYYSIFDKKELVNMKDVEDRVFALEIMKSYKMKYFLKTHSPIIHDFLVRVKSNIK
jgi:glycosyltransferase involved in cell wall biosynthesis